MFHFSFDRCFQLKRRILSFFDTSTFDLVEKDMKVRTEFLFNVASASYGDLRGSLTTYHLLFQVTTESALGVFGGTMHYAAILW